MANQIRDSMGFPGAGRPLHQNAACRTNLIHDAALLIIRRLWEKYFPIEFSIGIVQTVALITIIFRANLGKVCKFAGDVFALFDLLLDPFQGFSKAFGRAFSQNQSRSIFDDWLR